MFLKKETNQTFNYEHELEKTKESFFSKLKNLFSKKSNIDINVIDRIEEILLSADIGTKTTIKIINNLEKKVKKEKYENSQNIYNFLKEEIKNLFIDIENICLEKKIKKSIEKPYVILMVGVNGVGKTTTIGKLAFFLKKKGFHVIIGAADTFRAAAIDQLEIWSNKAGVPLVKQHIHADPASVAYDTLQSAKSKKKDVVLIDTAGRLQNRVSLMEELSKISRVTKKIMSKSPHEIILVLDATTGQNAFEQVRQFTYFIPISSIILTKIEGTAKGGVGIGIMNQFKIPIQYLGIGEKIQDLKVFDENKFVNYFFE
ncbi:signal recognition particle-docking protein FtsY [Blattabacterium sp. DPU]|uniref:signal recognition particle-docking protein FtsY n=1 Tax=Blattabacterium sp. DPU TaxID=2715232 RepID=UPI00140C83FA|nr:signal recognition particle-docking protein FtsY [Blattabacterium sp. DPU]QIK16862.1 signal recognition particle-docking protein FtsY [Blattabacterium sp. DPU]